jgi:TPR repeat protein
MYDDAKNDVQMDAIRDVMHRYGGYLLGLSYTEAMRSLPESLQDATEGLVWLERAAELGHKDAVHTLGNLYVTGQHPKVGFHVDKGMALWKKVLSWGMWNVP